MGWVLNATHEVNDSSSFPTIIAITVVLSVLASSIVGARLYIRYKARGLAGDDWMSALSMAFALIYSSICIARTTNLQMSYLYTSDRHPETRYGLGLPIPDRPEENLVPYTRINYAGRPFYQLGISFFKIALLISYLRLLRGTDHKTYRTAIWVTIALVFASHLGCALALVFACKPVSKLVSRTV
ncbi:hypothetical protein ACHAPU_000962 [Fusarium lateritium]